MHCTMFHPARQSSTRCLCGSYQAGLPCHSHCFRERRHAADLTQAGATTVIVNNTEAGTAMGSSLLSGLGVARESQLAYLTTALRKQMEARCGSRVRPHPDACCLPSDRQLNA